MSRANRSCVVPISLVLVLAAAARSTMELTYTRQK